MLYCSILYQWAGFAPFPDKDPKDRQSDENPLSLKIYYVCVLFFGVFKTCWCIAFFIFYAEEVSACLDEEEDDPVFDELYPFLKAIFGIEVIPLVFAVTGVCYVLMMIPIFILFCFICRDANKQREEGLKRRQEYIENMKKNLGLEDDAQYYDGDELV